MDEFVKSLHTLRAKKQKQINDTYIWYGIVLDGLGKLAKAKEFKDGRYSIPTLSERGKTVPRKKEDLVRIIQEAESTQINLILITYIVAQTEAYISEARKILKRVQGYQSQPELMMLSAQDFSFLKDPKKIILHWEEIKQTRHLLLHTNGLIDSDYIAKSGEIARGTLGTQIEVSRDYLEYCMKITKSLIGKIASHFKLKH